MSFAEQILSDVTLFLDCNQELFFNERDFQMHLALWLIKTGHYEDVDVEYAVPLKMLDNLPKRTPMESIYPWESELKVDIVVKKNNEYIPIELKYKTKSVFKKTIDRFGESIESSSIIKNQGAQDLGKYGFWKDVYRLELLKKRFHSVIQNGICIFLTNDLTYTKQNKKENANDVAFSMCEGYHNYRKHWALDTSKIAKSYPNFSLEKDYYIKWENSANECMYTIILI